MWRQKKNQEGTIRIIINIYFTAVIWIKFPVFSLAVFKLSAWRLLGNVRYSTKMPFGNRSVLLHVLLYTPIDQLILWRLDSSQQRAATLLLALAHLQSRSGGHLENFPHAILRLGRALQVTKGADPAGHLSAILCLHRLLHCLVRDC